MSRKVFVVILVCFIFGMQGLFAQEAFTWHLALVKDDQGISFDKTVNMKNGESFSIDLYTENDCYAYLIVEQASGALAPLLYSPIRAGTSKSVKCTLSPPAGQEKFYIVTSSIEQKELLNAIEAYNKDKSARNALILKNVLFEVRESKDEIPGRPVSIGGSVRGEDKIIQGTEFSGEAAYTRTIVISH